MTRKHVLAPTLADSEGFHVHRRDTSDNPTFESSAIRRIIDADTNVHLPDNRYMSEKPTKRSSTPPDQLRHSWYFAEHAMEHGFRQADAERALGWPRGKINALWNGKQRYTQETVDQVSSWLGIEPFELLMRPAEAAAIKQLRAAARMIASTPSPKAGSPVRRTVQT
ncbi:hypothetical protein [Brevundimonas nasdae]|uniref:hypothetical protein n=1 Tax=Brevundimonas nasdae TaxID=172043 RepID=UPI00289D1E96|nr:hypothetical protein [Brevundimonas nasdae]